MAPGRSSCRFIERFVEAKILRYPAMAEEDDANRSEGEALFPQDKSLPFLMERRAVNTIRILAGYNVFTDKVTGSKDVRAEPYAAQVQGGNVWLIAGPWHREYLEELEQFPSAKFLDQLDASTCAFNRLVGGSSYSLFSGWLED